MAESVTNTAKRLITFGCSHTVGEYLPGWYFIQNQVTFSNLAWPFILAHSINASVINMASGGESNHEMLLKILSFDFQPGDIAVVCWSYAGREMMYDLNSHTSLSRTMDLLDVYNDTRFYNLHTLHDLEMKSREYIHHAKLYLSHHCIPHLMSKIEPWSEYNKNWKDYSHDDFPLFEIVDRASDNLHPGIQSHRQFADKLYNILK